MSWNRSSQSQQKDAAASFKVNKLWVGVGLAVVALAAVGMWFVSQPSWTVSETRVEKPSKLVKRTSRSSLSPRDAVRAAMPKAEATAEKKRTKKLPIKLITTLTGDDRKMAEAMQTALDANDDNATLAAAQKALKSANPELRLEAVEALGWVGFKALPELTECMADADEEVQSAAAGHWEMAVSEMKEAADRFKVVMAAFATLSRDEQLSSLGGILSGAANEFIDGEEDASLAAEKRLQVIQSIADVIEGGSHANAEAAKEVYNDVTGNEWLGLDEAQRYLDDPENYDPDEVSSGAETVPDESADDEQED